MASIISYVPVLNRLVASPGGGETGIDIDPVEVHNVETSPEKRARTLKHLLRANHVNHSILYHNLQFDNHLAHLLSSAYILGASAPHLRHLYDKGVEGLEPWVDSPQEIVKDDWRDFLGDRRYQRAYVDFFEDTLASHSYSFDWKKVVDEFMFEGEEPLVNGLIGGRMFFFFFLRANATSSLTQVKCLLTTEFTC